MSIIIGESRESWIVKNISNKRVVIGDLPNIPSINPNKTINLLDYYVNYLKLKH